MSRLSWNCTNCTIYLKWMTSLSGHLGAVTGLGVTALRLYGSTTQPLNHCAATRMDTENDVVPKRASVTSYHRRHHPTPPIPSTRPPHKTTVAMADSRTPTFLPSHSHCVKHECWSRLKSRITSVTSPSTGPTNHRPQTTDHNTPRTKSLKNYGRDSPLRLPSPGPCCCRRCRPPRLPLQSV
jgi:hypothetical protein